jgi:hypothetical protein
MNGDVLEVTGDDESLQWGILFKEEDYASMQRPRPSLD